MTRLLVCLALAAAALFALPATASAGNDVARGHGVRPFDSFENFDFNAQSNFDGSAANGYLKLTEPDQDPNQKIVGEVTCLSVIGNIAAISGRITEVPPGFAAFQSFVLRVQDVAKPGDGADRFGVLFSLSPPPPPPSCAVFVPGTFQILGGDIVVDDATS